jgi:hypothetical protein
VFAVELSKIIEALMVAVCSSLQLAKRSLNREHRSKGVVWQDSPLTTMQVPTLSRSCIRLPRVQVRSTSEDAGARLTKGVSTF